MVLKINKVLLKYSRLPSVINSIFTRIIDVINLASPDIGKGTKFSSPDQEIMTILQGF